MTDTLALKINKGLERRHIKAQLAGYLSGFPEFSNRHPQELLPLAEHCLDGLEKICEVTFPLGGEGKNAKE